MLVQLSDVPRRECGRVESNHHSAEAAGLQPAELADAQRPHEGATDRIRTGTARFTTSDAAVTPQPPRLSKNGDDRTRTGDLSPDKRVLSPLSYAPKMARVGFEPTVSSS